MGLNTSRCLYLTDIRALGQPRSIAMPYAWLLQNVYFSEYVGFGFGIGGGPVEAMALDHSLDG